MDDELTTQEAADLIGVHNSRVRQLLRAGDLEPSRTIRGAYLIRRAEAERFRQMLRPKPGRPRKPKPPADAA